ncbi:MAG: hypothetical protein B7C54_00545 [Acidimicrobiales bacterium mtb01]|nr:MAG: hypothetical protein B7C54_00545 [Acidimicrobiales bacterium mtb01]
MRVESIPDGSSSPVGSGDEPPQFTNASSDAVAAIILIVFIDPPTSSPRESARRDENVVTSS